ncbi:glycoside hydrolase family 97 catalytic domain-containing protein [Lutibacter sp.]|uniref:glycoside hydrolase family 97 protein n=1 Tax=Lutibacter sp. TaxID=1925666 RepID=UPI003565A416
MNKRIFFIVVGLFFLLQSCSKNKNEYKVNSPNNLVKLTFNVDNGSLNYNVDFKNKVIVDTSSLSIFENVPVEILNAEIKSNSSSWEPVWGQFSEIKDEHNQLVLNLKMGDKTSKLIAKVFDDGVAFKFEVDNILNTENVNLFCEYNISKDGVFYTPAGESVPKGPFTITGLENTSEELPKLLMPLVFETANNVHIAILESDLFEAKGFNAMKLNFDKESKKLISTNKVNLVKDKLVSPWKVILIGETAGDLVTNTIPVNIATPCKIENTDWIKPGKTLWDWRVHGYTAPDGFTYGIDNESYKRFIDFAAEKEIEYFLIDDSWYKHASKGHFELSEKLDLNEISEYAKKKGVDLILYYDRKHGEYGDKELFPYYQSIGMSGIKYGFMGKNIEFSRDAIKQSAESELLIDFHDNPVPFTGVSRTYPNAISREYCHAQQDSRRAFTPEAFIKMALVNAIQGPLDMNNGNFDITGINSGIREKSPRRKNSYFSTVVSEAARTLIIFSGLVCIPDAPEAYNAKADLFKFIQKMPVGKWDETRILNSKMSEYITTARRYGKEWFIGSVINRKGGSLDINLDFLEEDIAYEVTFYEDTFETDCETNPEAYQIRKAKVKKGEIIKAQMAKGGGHCMWIKPMNK